MSEEMMTKSEVYTAFVNYVTEPKDSLPTRYCWNNSQMAVYMILEKQ